MRSSSDWCKQQEGRLGGKEWCEGGARGSWAIWRSALLLSASNHDWKRRGGQTHRDSQYFHTGGSAWTRQLDEIIKPGRSRAP